MELGRRLMEVLGFYRIISPVHPIRLVTNNLHGGRRIHPARLRFVLAACRKSWIRRLVILALRQAALRSNALYRLIVIQEHPIGV